MTTYEHEVTLDTPEFEPSATVFTQNPAFSKNFLGRAELDRMRVAIVDYDRMVFLSSYGA